MIDEAWDLPALREHYEQFIDDFEPAAARRGGAATFAAQTAIVHAWRRFPFIDPDLPGRPAARATGRAARAYELFRERHERWAPAAQEHFDELTAVTRPQAHLRRLLRRHDRDEADRRRLRAGPRAPGLAGPPDAGAQRRATCRSSSSPSTSRCWTRPTRGPRTGCGSRATSPQHRHSYDGFVVLHGTDTMAYTASALAFLLRGLGKPVVVTGSQIPLGVLRSDGRQNLLTARARRRARRRPRGLPRLRLADPARRARGEGERERLRGLHLAQRRRRSAARAC